MGIGTNVRFMGAVSNPSEIYQMFSIFVLSTHYEGHPLVIFEAMSFGLPIVATRISSIPEVIKDRVNGLLVKPKDPHDMAEAIQKLLTDQLLYIQLSEASLKTFKAQPSVSEWAERVLSVYEEVVTSRAR
jgi:glycosyltransferase involved in cell wall biosynthesis